MSESLETAFGDAAPDPASDIAVAVMSLKWAQGGDADEHCFRYGDIQEIADPIIQAALSQACADALAQGRREGLEEAAKAAEIMPAQILAFYARPGGPPGNGYRAPMPADYALAIRFLATAPTETQKSILKGWKLVPLEPTPEMLAVNSKNDIGVMEPINGHLDYFSADEIYRAMVAAAPAPVEPTVSPSGKPWVTRLCLRYCGDAECNCHASPHHPSKRATAPAETQKPETWESDHA